jgi:hypothetical protein
VKKFEPLAEFLRGQTLSTIELSFPRIEEIIGSKLPKSAYRPQYWANTTAATGPVSSALKGVMYDSFLVAGSKKVQFRRYSR